MTARATITADQRNKENSIRFSLVADSLMLVMFLVIGVAGGSLTLIAEAIRGAFIFSLEAFSLLVMRRVHRESLFDMDFGTGKVEQIANLVIAFGMLIGALWVFYGVIGIIAGEKPLGSPLGLMLAAVIAAVNTYINVVAWDTMRRAARGGKSIIMQAQLRSRHVRVFSSLFIQVTMTVAAVSSDSVVAIWAEAIGSSFVACFILATVIDMFRAGLPDLLDRSVEEEAQFGINRALAKHFSDYDSLGQVRSRRSGHTVFIEIVLGFDPTLSMAEVNRRTVEIKGSMEAEIDNADVSILATATGPVAP
jgi:cation diffusion facilitator family transporter